MLPLLAGAAKLKIITLAIPFAILITGLGAAGSWACLYSLSSHSTSSTMDTTILVLFFLPVSLLLLVGGVGAVDACMRDLLRPSPILVLDSIGLRDMRMGGALIAWHDVRRATIYRSRAGLVAGVSLLLRHPVSRRPHPFHPGLLGVAWARRGDLHLPLMLLDKKGEVLGHTIATMVQQHGGRAGEQRKDEDWVRLFRISTRRFWRRWRT